MAELSLLTTWHVKRHVACDKCSMCCMWFAHNCAQATWACVLEMVRSTARRLSKILNCAFECGCFYYYYYCNPLQTCLSTSSLVSFSLGSFESVSHNSSHRIRPVKRTWNKQTQDQDYLSFSNSNLPGNYNYLDPNYMPAVWIKNPGACKESLFACVGQNVWTQDQDDLSLIMVTLKGSIQDFYNLLTLSQTVSNKEAHMIRAQSCTNHFSLSQFQP